MSLEGCEGAVSRMIREPEYLLIMELYILWNPVAEGFIELLLRIKYGIPEHIDYARGFFCLKIGGLR